MAAAEVATIVERCANGNPAKIKANDDAGGTTVYAVRYDKPMKRPESGMELVYDDLHLELIRLDTKDGDTKLRRPGTGLLDSCVILINLGVAKTFGHSKPNTVYPAAAAGMLAFGEADYEYFRCEKE